MDLPDGEGGKKEVEEGGERGRERTRSIRLLFSPRSVPVPREAKKRLAAAITDIEGFISSLPAAARASAGVGGGGSRKVPNENPDEEPGKREVHRSANRGVSGRSRRVAGCTSHLRGFIPLYYPPQRPLVADVADFVGQLPGGLTPFFSTLWRKQSDVA